MKPEREQLDVRMPFLQIGATGQTARILGKATRVLILAVAMSIVLLAIKYAPFASLH